MRYRPANSKEYSSQITLWKGIPDKWKQRYYEEFTEEVSKKIFDALMTEKNPATIELGDLEVRPTSYYDPDWDDYETLTLKFWIYPVEVQRLEYITDIPYPHIWYKIPLRRRILRWIKKRKG